MGKFVYDFQLDDLIGQETYRPAGASLGWVGTGEQAELRFDFTGHFDGSGGSHRFFVQDGWDTFIQKAASGIGSVSFELAAPFTLPSAFRFAARFVRFCHRVFLCAERGDRYGSLPSHRSRPHNAVARALPHRLVSSAYPTARNGL